MSLASLPPESAALLVIDLQNAFCHPDGAGGASGEELDAIRDMIPVLARVAFAFVDGDFPVIWVRRISSGDDAASACRVFVSEEARRAQLAAPSGSWDAEIVDALRALADDPTRIVNRHRSGAFHATRLDSLLRAFGVRSLFVTGASVDCGIDTTLREAEVRDYDAVVIADAVASVGAPPTGVGQNAWGANDGALASSADVLEWVRSTAPPRADQLHHVLLECRDLDASVRFYTDVLGIRVRVRDVHRDGRPLVLTHNGLGLTSGGSGAGGTIEHLAIRARGVDALAARAERSGARIVRGPGPGPYGHTVYVEDPDGNEIELFE